MNWHLSSRITSHIMIICSDWWLSLFSFEMELFSMFFKWPSNLSGGQLFAFLVTMENWSEKSTFLCGVVLIWLYINIVYLHDVNKVMNSYLTDLNFVLLFCVFLICNNCIKKQIAVLNSLWVCVIVKPSSLGLILIIFCVSLKLKKLSKTWFTPFFYIFNNW